MFDVPGSVKSLRRYYKDKLTVPSADGLVAELAGESDRAAIILLTALIESALAYRIGSSLSFRPNEAQFDHAFRFEGPLGTFSARIEIAFLFGLIDETTRTQLDLVREMRNACAHSKYEMHFGVQELANVAKRLFRPLGVAHPIDHSRKSLREAFTIEAMIIFYVLVEGSREQGIASFNSDLNDAGLKMPSRDKPPQP